MKDKQTVEDLKAKIEALKNGKQENSVWNILAQKTKGLTQQEVQRVYGTQRVKIAKDRMFEVFNCHFLFEKFKDEFACLAPFKPFVDEYINAVIEVVDNQAETLQQENEELKRKIAELEKERGKK